MKTPIAVPWKASAKRTRVPGSAARRIACHDEARNTIETIISATASSTHAGCDRSTAEKIACQPMRSSAR